MITTCEVGVEEPVPLHFTKVFVVCLHGGGGHYAESSLGHGRHSPQEVPVAVVARPLENLL